MLLSEIFNQLTHGELSQYSVGGKSDNGIQFEDYPEVISHINSGLTALHKRFILSRKEIIIVPDTAIKTYRLESKFLSNNLSSTEPVKYLFDSTDYPFSPVINIESVFDSYGLMVPINQKELPNSVFVNSYNSIQIPDPDPLKPYSVIYVADHERLDTDFLYPDEVEIVLPDVLIPALMAYVAYRVALGNPSLSEINVNDSGKFLNQYEMVCVEVENRNLLRTEEIMDNLKLETNGWV